MTIKLTPSGLPRIGSQHKAPYFGRPFRCTLYSAFRKGSYTEGALFTLLKTIRAGKFQPFFSQEELENLSHEHNLKIVNGEPYWGEIKFDSIPAWGHMVANIAQPALSGGNWLKDYKQDPFQEKIAVITDLQSSLRKLKMIEDWIYYHRNVLDGIISTEDGHLLKSKYVRQSANQQMLYKEKTDVIRTVLIIDDEQTDILLIQYALKKLKLKTMVINTRDSTAEQIIEQAKKEGIDLIIMDGFMHDINNNDLFGDKLTEELRKKGFHGYIIANSGLPDKQKEMLAAGADFMNADKQAANLLNFFEP